MKQFTLKDYIFLALCSDIGIICKKLISPMAKTITESLHIPGGISTAFSLAFVVIGAVVVDIFGAAMIMSIIQWGVAISLGSVGSLGMLAIIAYFIPGLVIDIILWIFRKTKSGIAVRSIVSCALAGLSSCLVSDLLIFHLSYPIVILYGGVALITGAFGGSLAALLAGKIVGIYSTGRG